LAGMPMSGQRECRGALCVGAHGRVFVFVCVCVYVCVCLCVCVCVCV
jgi:hypothetical protein